MGDPNAPVTIVSSGRVAALVSAVDQPEIMPTRRHMLAHTKVLEAAMADRPVLPMRFGVIAPSPATLLQVIGPRSQELRALLGQIDGHIEVALKASWNEQFMWREVAAEHPHLAVSGRALMSRNEQQTYYDRIDLGRAIGAALEEKRAAARRQLLKIVAPFAVQVKELAPVDDAMFAHLALLVEEADRAGIVPDCRRARSIAEFRADIQIRGTNATLQFRRGEARLGPACEGHGVSAIRTGDGRRIP